MLGFDRKRARKTGDWVVRALLAVLLATAAPASAGTGFCVGDCDGSDDVTVDELVTMVNIALGEKDVSLCGRGDANGDDDITVDEILQATSNALAGCRTAGLGVRRFVLSPPQSPFEAVLGPNIRVELGRFRGQTNGEVGDAFLDLEAGEPDADGIATVNVTAASEYIFAQATITPLTICARLLVPAPAAGFVDCDGGSDVSLATVVDHRLGQVGIDGFTAEDCAQMEGSVESPNQICETGVTGDLCAEDGDCETAPGAADGSCGMQDSVCTEGAVGRSCRADADCDSQAGTFDGVCGTPAPHPGVCNGPIVFEQTGTDSGPGAVSIGPLLEAGVDGLPVELTLESSPPCGDEGPGTITPFAFTTGTASTTILRFSDTDEDLEFVQQGANLDCGAWRTGKGGRFVLGFPALHLNPIGGGDIITAFNFGEATE